MWLCEIDRHEAGRAKRKAAHLCTARVTLLMLRIEKTSEVLQMHYSLFYFTIRPLLNIVTKYFFFQVWTSFDVVKKCLN